MTIKELLLYKIKFDILQTQTLNRSIINMRFIEKKPQVRKNQSYTVIEIEKISRYEI